MNTDKVAAIIRKQYDLVRDPEVPTSASVALEEVVIDLATLYAEGNPAFDTRKFHLAALGHIDAHLDSIERDES